MVVNPSISGNGMPNMKVLLVGSTGVGKSSLMLRFAADVFNEELATTIGIDFRVKKVEFDEPPAEGMPSAVNVQIWDTAGQERFRTLTSSYYRGAHAIIFVHDLTQPASLTDVEYWLAEANTHCGGREVVQMLISNKTDLVEDPAELAASVARAAAVAREHKMLHFACSAKRNEGVAAAFREVAQRAAEQPSFVARVLSTQNESTNGGFVKNVSDSVQSCSC